MSPVNDGQQGDVTARPRFGSRLRRLGGSRDGAAAIEFAILAIPYFMIIFAIIETFVAFAAEQLLHNAVNTVSRQLRTGQITFGLNRPATDKTEAEFRALFCDEISILMKCDAAGAATNKLWIDVRSFNTFSNIPTTIPRKTSDPFSDLDTDQFKFQPGGSKSINMVRVYYKWQITADIVRPYITTIRPADGSMPSDFLIVGTTAFQNEDFP